VTDTAWAPVVELEHDSVALRGEGGRETVVGLTEQLTPEAADAPRLMVAVRPFIELIVTANVAVDPVLMV
jgi:hypothetical protein